MFLGVAQADIKADKQAAVAACSKDATTAGCAYEPAGKGLFKCLHTYKKANDHFQFSPECKAAIAALHADRKAQTPPAEINPPQ